MCGIHLLICMFFSSKCMLNIQLKKELIGTFATEYFIMYKQDFGNDFERIKSVILKIRVEVRTESWMKIKEVLIFRPELCHFGNS